MTLQTFEAPKSQSTKACENYSEEIMKAGSLTSKSYQSENDTSSSENSGRERLKRHRMEVAGRVWIPEIWGQEDLLKDWIDCSAFDASLFPSGIISARAALVEEGRNANTGGLRIENRC